MMLDNFKNYIQKHSDITDEQFLEISHYLKSKSIKKGDFVLRQGEICSSSFFVSKGLLRSYTIDEQGKEHIIQFAPEDWMIVDRSSFFFNEPSELFIDAVEDTELVMLNEDFITLASNISTVYRAFNHKALHSHIRHLQKRVNLLLGATAEQRYLDFIKLYPELTLRLPQWMIASYLGLTPESLSRVRKELARRNFKPH
ncbi:Crp/Fnr family transcriptional regulator [Pedobacter aquae]|nr:Crp/Fnr family transcriptional regulator [Pedobacter aquae]